METRCWKACTARGTWAQSGHLFSYAFASLRSKLQPRRSPCASASFLFGLRGASLFWSACFAYLFVLHELLRRACRHLSMQRPPLGSGAQALIPSRPLFLMRTHAFAVSHWPTAHVAHNDCTPTYINILYVRAAWAGACSLGAPDCQSAALPSARCADALRSPGQERIEWPFLCHRRSRRAVGCQSSISIFFLLFLHDACAPARLEMAGHRRAPKSASTSFLNNLIYLLSVSMTTGALEGWPLSAGGRKIRSLARRGVGGWLRWVAAALPPPPPPMRCCSTCWLPEAARRLGPRLRMNRNKEIATGGAID